MCDELNDSSILLERNIERCVELVMRIKQLAVEDTGPAKKHSLDGVIEHVIKELTVPTQHIKVDLVGTEIELYCHYQQLYLLFKELISNSVQHGLTNIDSPTIFIQAEAKEGKVDVIYKDNGAGVAKSVAGNIFDPFTTTARGKGQTGLGLSLVYNLVTQAFNGTVELCDEPIGLCFKFSFPQDTGQSHFAE